MKKIVIEIIPHSEQRYPTVGDWIFEYEGTLHIFVSELGDIDQEIDVAIHELIEARLCQKNGISEQSVTAFDLQFEKERANGKHDLSDECGDDKRAPYHDEHQSATFVERSAASVLGVDWYEYGKKIEALD